MEDLREFDTRKKRIDIFLRDCGWEVNDPSKVRVEIDSKQSNFEKRDYKNFSETFKNNEESKYIDYLLLDKKGDPLAIIEAKRTIKDPLIGKKQAVQYAEDIFNKTGKPVFIFLTNGYEIWYWNWNEIDPYENMRMISGFIGQEELERRRWQNNNAISLMKAKIDKKIIDRDYQIEAVKRILDGIHVGRRKFLIVQATGTGKTRVSMALIKSLQDSRKVEKVLFLTDRKALRDQAFNDGFKAFFPNESRQKVFSGKVDRTANLYSSTIQTFMECYQDFDPGYFDLIISDEAHRSIYNKWRDVFTYFDALQVGLTATPSDVIEKDTFRFFECKDQSPTFVYTYEQAVKDDWLADFKVQSASTNFQIEGISPKDIPQSIKDKLSEEGILEDSLFFEGTDIERKVSITGTNEAIIDEFMKNCLVDATGTLPAKSIIFAVSKKHAKGLYEAFERLYPEYKSKLVEVITSEDPRADELLEDFKKKDFPRIAISVDMLDTGIDVAEVCNLVFAKPVFSKIKFWQMIGRGTRHDKVCKHREWLPNKKKEFFLIFDFWKNMEYFDMHPEGRKSSSGEALPSKIFLLRLEQYEYFLKKKEDKKAEYIKNKLILDTKELPRKLISVRSKDKEIELVISGKLWKRTGAKPSEFLRKEIAPIIRYLQDVNYNVASFTLKCERLGLALLKNDEDTIEKIKEDISDIWNYIPIDSNIKEIKEQKELLNKLIYDKEYWTNLNYENLQEIIEKISPLMIFKRSEPVTRIELDIEDVIKQRKIIEFGPIGDEKQEYVEVYKNKVENRIKELTDKHPTIKKIRNDEIISERDIEELEKSLNSPELFITEETLQKLYGEHKGTIIEFIKKIMGMYKYTDSKERIEEAFRTFIIELDGKVKLSSEQISFVRTLKTVFSAKKHIEYRDLFEPPFTNIPNAPVPLFKKEALQEILVFCTGLEKEVKI